MATTSKRRCASIPVVLLLSVSLMSLTACGSSSKPTTQAGNTTTANKASATATPTVAPSATPVPEGAPAGPFIAVCNETEIDYFNPTTGAPITQQTIASLRAVPDKMGGTDATGIVGKFDPTRLPLEGGLTGTCGGNSYNGSLTKLVGLDKYQGGDTVPAVVDLKTGTVTDLVPPTNRSGFTAKPTVTYLAAAFNPLNDDLWYVLSDVPTSSTAKSGAYILIGPNGFRRSYRFGFGGSDPSPRLHFSIGSSTPVLGDPASFTPVQTTPVGETLFGSFDDVPSTGYSVQTIRHPDSGGTGGAFIAYAPNSQTPELFVMSAKGATPKKIATVTPTASQGIFHNIQVARYKDS